MSGISSMPLGNDNANTNTNVNDNDNDNDNDNEDYFTRIEDLPDNDSSVKILDDLKEITKPKTEDSPIVFTEGKQESWFNQSSLIQGLLTFMIIGSISNIYNFRFLQNLKFIENIKNLKTSDAVSTFILALVGGILSIILNIVLV
jgi:hypothetical protein